MVTMPSDLQQRLRQYGQEHVVAHWDTLDDAGRRAVLDQLRGIDLEQIHRLHGRRGQGFALPPAERIKPVPVTRLDGDTRAARQAGEEALRRGEVAALVVAGGQGSRLGFPGPKGTFPVGPVSNKSLFQIHAEKVLSLRRRYEAAVPLLVMTSDATHADTEDFFRAHDRFGLPGDDVFFFKQGTMPAVDLETGRLLLEAPGRLFTSPNGHGGTLTALADSGLLRRLRDRGVRHLFYFQVDNPLVKVGDPVFLGHHLLACSQASSKVVPKEGPKDKLGNMVLIDGRCSIIEYSDLPEDLARQTDPSPQPLSPEGRGARGGGRLRIWAGSPAIHIFDQEFLGYVTADAERLPFHLARKKVPYIDEAGKVVEPAKENALKFEKFIFDVLPLAERWAVVETSRREEFEPLKNATGPDSPETVRRALGRLAADWLEAAGVRVPRDAHGEPVVPLEVSPLFALDREEFVAKLCKPVAIDGPRYFG
jgi:UDP-N-acetylglucosamine/UDP-N-acetylgalactosamine diphosphorylase